MKAIFGLMGFLAAASCASQPARAAEPVEGRWQFYKKVFEGNEMPEPEDGLKMFWEYGADGTSRLWWERKSSGESCNRKGEYHVEGDEIVEKATWIDPANTPFCEKDPDMTNGRETRNKFELRNGELVLFFHLNNEPLELVWKKVEGARR